MSQKYPWENQIYLSRKEVARILNRAYGTLANWATEGRGPKALKIEGRVCYATADLKAYLQEQGFD
ncbi:hypothetical protein BCS96_13690 [Vibrio breoganii]|uniref:helix-turn-helix transcriptional regulator n=1 Tax=Vibrio breoganii TaxID=553239 RepID=UPI000C8185B7|nr:helix-turn-helix domain-containing protein [Vibrio breoganii]PMF98868.1 hypothetical protein BCV02_16640 [Vibrio breoganii]PMG32330.1 hypothetical protein BCU93_00760 [Vibrio breoganii]PMG82406.1 hypothetical protein BCU81_03115 [Vibrio breoganii]PMG92144.1 hypothetical protein BCU80_11380 [Vibrio breoganii]PMK17135.1 hypothetical protein BCU06_10845 [Vibrio breoganii]